jgi:diguanylate cyclase (GGDEF)-like protein
VLSGRAWPVAFTIYGAVFACVILGGAFSDETRSLVANAWYLPIGAASIALAWQIVRTRDLPSHQRIAWRLVALALVVTFVSDALWLYVENYRGEDPSESILANLGYLSYYPLLLASLLLLSAALRSRRDAIKFALDVATVVVAGGMAVWHFVISPVLASHEASPVASFLALAYPIGDLLLLIGLAAILLHYPAGARRRPIMFLAGSAAAMLIADVVWAHLSLSGAAEAGNIQDIPYLLQYVLFAIGISEERRRLRSPERDDQEQAAGTLPALPYVAVVGGYGLLMDVDWRSTNGDVFPVAIGAVILTVLVARQILALRENVKLSDRAYRDPLTGLANRAAFQHRLEEALSRYAANRSTVAVLFIDLDEFKGLNDTYGHGFGDAVLRSAAQRIVSHLRQVDLAARLGGDEFAVLLEDPDGRIDPPAIGERIAQALRAPMVIEARELALAASVGVAIAALGQSADDVQREADLAMYMAKRRGGGHAAMFETPPILRRVT